MIHHDGLFPFLLRLAMRRRRVVRVWYGGEAREVEPYSMLGKKLYAVAPDTGGTLAILIGDIRKIRVLPVSFVARYEVEV